MGRLIRWMPIAIGVAICVATTTAQEPAHFHSASSDLVVLSASVTNADGGFASGVPGEHFAIFDNGKRQPIALFSSDDSPVSVGLIIDNSSSMRAKAAEVLAATIEFARKSNPDDELFALAFNDDVHEALHDRRFLMADDVDALQQAVSSLRPDGRTALYDAIVTGLDRLDEGTRARKVLIVLSDGGDNASTATLHDVIERARRSDATIYTIGLFDSTDRDRNPGVLREIAQTTGGERYLPESAGPLMQVCQRIARDIRTAYTLAFEPSARDGRYHHLDVRVGPVNGRRLEVRARTGYVAPGPVTP
jgi:Ca-activated chloride channel family protein